MLLKNLPSAEQLIDTAFKRAKKAVGGTARQRDKFRQIKEEEALFVKAFGDYLVERLEESVKETPDFSALPGMLGALVKCTVDLDLLKKALAHLNETRKLLKKLKYEYLRLVYSTSRKGPWSAASKKRKEFVGRASSMVKRAKATIEVYNGAVKKLGELPRKELWAEDTIVLAGMPNAGKTTLFKKMTGSNAKIASYAFTTTKLNIGSFEKDHKKTVVIDTPGLLEKMPGQRNRAEGKAIAALEHGAKKAVFVVDPTGSSGYGLEEQLRLVEALGREFRGKKKYYYLSRKDLAAGEEVKKALEALETVAGLKEYIF